MANLRIIKDLIRKNGYTIKSFADEINISEQGLQKLIRENSTKVDTLERIAKQLNVSPIIFFDESVLSSDTEQSESLIKLIDNNALLTRTNARLAEINTKLTDHILDLANNQKKSIADSA